MRSVVAKIGLVNLLCPLLFVHVRHLEEVLACVELDSAVLLLLLLSLMPQLYFAVVGVLFVWHSGKIMRPYALAERLAERLHMGLQHSFVVSMLPFHHVAFIALETSSSRLSFLNVSQFHALLQEALSKAPFPFFSVAAAQHRTLLPEVFYTFWHCL
jgi:hypothetical protein